jgi:hypothetical protein
MQYTVYHFVGSQNPGRAVGRMCGMFSGGRSERSYVEIYGLLLSVRLALDQTRDANWYNNSAAQVLREEGLSRRCVWHI